jgi:hypothetical protein
MIESEMDTDIVKQGYGVLTQINPMTVLEYLIDSHVIGFLFLFLLFVNCLSFTYLLCITPEGTGILPIRLVYSPEGGVGNFSWPLSG